MANNTYTVGDTDYEFPDTMKPEEVKQVLVSKGIIKPPEPKAAQYPHRGTPMPPEDASIPQTVQPPQRQRPTRQGLLTPQTPDTRQPWNVVENLKPDNFKRSIGDELGAMKEGTIDALYAAPYLAAFSTGVGEAELGVKATVEGAKYLPGVVRTATSLLAKNAVLGSIFGLTDFAQNLIKGEDVKSSAIEGVESFGAATLFGAGIEGTLGAAKVIARPAYKGLKETAMAQKAVKTIKKTIDRLDTWKNKIVTTGESMTKKIGAKTKKDATQLGSELSQQMHTNEVEITKHLHTVAGHVNNIITDIEDFFKQGYKSLYKDAPNVNTYRPWEAFGQELGMAPEQAIAKDSTKIVSPIPKGELPKGATGGTKVKGERTQPEIDPPEVQKAKALMRSIDPTTKGEVKETITGSTIRAKTGEKTTKTKSERQVNNVPQYLRNTPAEKAHEMIRTVQKEIDQALKDGDQLYYKALSNLKNNLTHQFDEVSGGKFSEISKQYAQFKQQFKEFAEPGFGKTKTFFEGSKNTEKFSDVMPSLKKLATQVAKGKEMTVSDFKEMGSDANAYHQSVELLRRMGLNKRADAIEQGMLDLVNATRSGQNIAWQSKMVKALAKDNPQVAQVESRVQEMLKELKQKKISLEDLAAQKVKNAPWNPAKMDSAVTIFSGFTGWFLTGHLPKPVQEPLRATMISVGLAARYTEYAFMLIDGFKKQAIDRAVQLKLKPALIASINAYYQAQKEMITELQQQSKEEQNATQ